VRLENSTTWNYNQLVDGEFDLLLAYEPSQEAIDYAAEKGFEWEIQPIGRDALVFIANIENPVQELSSQQITDIYTGKITDWSALGGNTAAIIPYQRNRDSGSQTLFDLFFPLGEELMEPPSEQVVGSMIGLLEVIADYDNSVDALGYTVYYYLSNMETDKLSRSQVLAVDGVEATNESIASGEYPYTNDFYVVIPADLPEDAPARVLFNWICSDQVKELGENENYVML
ncbi:MAG: substrate-binding domain-containing protein, partial [Bacillota bacterium]|nr:substrate-binding domain-containing protein [Bacillota bacterium]